MYKKHSNTISEQGERPVHSLIQVVIKYVGYVYYVYRCKLKNN